MFVELAHLIKCFQASERQCDKARTTGTHGPLWNALDLLPHELLELVRALDIRRGLIIVLPTVVKHQLGISDKNPMVARNDRSATYPP